MSTVQFIIQLLALLACLPHCSLGEKPAALVASGEGSLYPDLPDPEHTATEEEINSRELKISQFSTLYYLRAHSRLARCTELLRGGYSSD